MKRWLAAMFAAVALAAAHGAATAQTVRFATISEGTYVWPLYVAQAKRLFEREGVSVQFTVSGSATRHLEELLRGTYDIGLQQNDGIVRVTEGGADLFIFLPMAHLPAFSLITAPSITRIEDLRGKAVAVDSPRGGYTLLLRRMLAAKGLTTADYTMSLAGGSKEKDAAMRSGTALATLINPPFDANLVASGFRNLGAITEQFPDYPGPTGAVRRAWARDNEKSLIAFIRGFNAAYAWLQDPKNKNEAIEILNARLNIAPALAADEFDAFGAQPRPKVTPGGLRQVIDMVWEAEGFKTPPGAPKKYFDLGYLQKAGE